MAGRPGAFSFPKSRRLLERRDFRRLEERGDWVSRVSGRYFTVVVQHGTRQARLGLVASRRVGSAVRRNRAKRLVREYFRHAAAEWEPLDLVVIVKSGAERLSAQQAARELSATLERAFRRGRAS